MSTAQSLNMSTSKRWWAGCAVTETRQAQPPGRQRPLDRPSSPRPRSGVAPIKSDDPQAWRGTARRNPVEQLLARWQLLASATRHASVAGIEIKELDIARRRHRPASVPRRHAGPPRLRDIAWRFPGLRRPAEQIAALHEQVAALPVGKSLTPPSGVHQAV